MCIHLILLSLKFICVFISATSISQLNVYACFKVIAQDKIQLKWNSLISDTKEQITNKGVENKKSPGIISEAVCSF